MNETPGSRWASVRGPSGRRRDLTRAWGSCADVGGKVCSTPLGPEGRAAELGQLAIGAGYDRTLALARQVGVDVVSMSGRSFVLHDGTITLEDLHAVQAAWIRWRHAVLAATDDVDDRSVFDVLSSLDLDDAFTNSMARVLWTACGYGALTSTSTPAIYLRRYLQRVATDEPVTLRVPEGNQHLWRTIRTALAPHAVVETGAVITSVARADRADGGVMVRLANGEVRCFAQVVLALPPAVAATIIDDDGVAVLGVADPSVLQARQWAYFPHLRIDERRATEQALDEQQGKGGVWLTGVWRTFETVEHAVVDGEAVARAVCHRLGRQV